MACALGIGALGGASILILCDRGERETKRAESKLRSSPSLDLLHLRPHFSQAPRDEMAAPAPATSATEQLEGQNPTIAAHQLVARFLRTAGASLASRTLQTSTTLQSLTVSQPLIIRTAGYNATLAAFQRESLAEHPELILDDTARGPDLKEVVEDYISSRIASLSVAPAPLEAELDNLEPPAVIPSKVRDSEVGLLSALLCADMSVLQVVTAIRDHTNVLSVKPGVFPRRTWNSAELKFTRLVAPKVGCGAELTSLRP